MLTIKDILRKTAKILKDFRGMSSYGGVSLALQGAIAKFRPPRRPAYYNKIAESLFQDFTLPVIRRYHINLDSLDSPGSTYRNDGPIWVMWWQGVDESTPKIVRACIDSTERHAHGRKVIIVDRQNYSRYVDLPSPISSRFQRGEITITVLSDYIRFALLYKFGGMWVDATLYLTDDFPADIQTLPVYTRHENKEPDKDRWIWAIYFIGGAQNNPLFYTLLKTYESYWEQRDQQVDYLMTDILILGLYRNSNAVQHALEQVPFNNSRVFYLATMMGESAQKALEPHDDTYAHKLTYKFQPKSDASDTWFDKVCEGRL